MKSLTESVEVRVKGTVVEDESKVAEIKMLI